MAAASHIFVRLRSPVTGQWAADPSLRPRIVEDAKAKGVSMSAMMIELLCDAYRIEYKPTGMPGNAKEQADEINLRVPPELEYAIGLNALAHKCSRQTEIIATLSRHYGLPVPVRTRRRRRRRTTHAEAA